MEPNPDIVKADVLVTVHLAFVAFVVLGQLLILIGWVAGWQWVRNFWFRIVHLLSIAIVAAEGMAGVECPLTSWEQDYRGGNLLDVSESSFIGALANHILYYQGDPVWFQRGHIAFGVLVLLTFFLVLPRLPGRSPAVSPKDLRDTERETPTATPQAASQTFG